MSNSLSPYIAKFITSDQWRDSKRCLHEIKRKALTKPHTITVYIRINDPYSYLLLQKLQYLVQTFKVSLEFKTVLHLQSIMYPERALWDKNAFIDGQHLAQQHQLNYPQHPPSDCHYHFSDNELTAQLLSWEHQAGFLERALSLFHAFWHNNLQKLKQIISIEVSKDVTLYQSQLHRNEQDLAKYGHYLSATLHYGGEWYWGVDRLYHLKQRLQKLSLNTNITPIAATIIENTSSI